MTLASGYSFASATNARSRLGSCLASLILGCLGASSVQAATPSWTDHLVRLDPTRWYISNGWSDGAWMLNNFLASQLVTSQSGLSIVLDKAAPGGANPYASGEVRTVGAFQYGYFEARVQAPAGAGLDAGFFTYVGASGAQPVNEIDVELLGKNTRAVQLTYHNGSNQVATTVALPFDDSAGPHLYAFDWQPTYIRWYVDGKLVLQQTGTNLPLPTAPQQLFMNLWASNSLAAWLGSFTWPNHPLTARVTCVAVEPHYTATPAC